MTAPMRNAANAARERRAENSGTRASANPRKTMLPVMVAVNTRPSPSTLTASISPVVIVSTTRSAGREPGFNASFGSFTLTAAARAGRNGGNTPAASVRRRVPHRRRKRVDRIPPARGESPDDAARASGHRGQSSRTARARASAPGQTGRIAAPPTLRPRDPPRFPRSPAARRARALPSVPRRGQRESSSRFHQPGDDPANAIPESAILDIARSVPLRRAHVDHRIELKPPIALLGGIEVNAPQMLLRRTVLDQRRLFIRMQLTADGHHSPLYVDNGF